NSVWTELGEAPLAGALRWVTEIAAKTIEAIAGNFSDMINAQNTWGWNVDYAAILALSSVVSQEDIEAVFSAIRSVYLPWMDRNARNLQKEINENGYPLHYKKHLYSQDECVCFIDGLRFDLAKKLSENFKTSGMSVKEEIVWTPLPTVTATCKPSLTPITDMITGDDFNNQDFSPIIKTSGQPATSERIYNIMEDQGWTILEDSKLGKLNHNGWYNFGRIDEEGHKLGWRIAPQVDNYINDVQERVSNLFKAGWKTVKIVSDHGWLLMPGGLPKMQMPISLTESKWGRCAAIKPGALFDGTCYPWYWNENVHFALADGVCCYRNGIEYTHGGVSLQECLMLHLVLSENDESHEIKEFLVTDIIWKKMRCRIAAEGNISGIKADIRTKPAMADTSIVMGIKEFNEAGLVSVVVDDDAHEGKTAYIVLLDSNNKVIYRTTTVVGGGE
ncbi:MAG: BREX-1 system phosphatase PglZ type B, partial [Candidatus Methanoperedens sp.]|nr:BREX-1 system phosphatase PglZ type B [Candidatus Methanoperedens sp.]